MPAEQFVINIVTTGDRDAVTSANRVSGAYERVGVSAKAASAASASSAASVARKWSGAGDKLAAAGRKMNRTITLPILAIGAVSGKMAIDFEKSMRNVNSIAQLPEPAFKRLNKEVLRMAGPTAQAPKTLAEGLYDLVSSGFDANESIQVLNASARAATAGLTTTEVSTKAVAAALNAYHRPASDAKAISDDLFQTVNLGVVTFDELASTIGYVLPAANTMGIDLKQVGASIATLTKQGQSGSNAVTNINAAITSFIKPSKDMKSLLKELGYETSAQLVHQKGFQGAIETVTDAVGGNREAIGELFPNVRSMRAVFALTGSGAQMAAKDIRGFASDTGATSKVLAEQSKSLSFQWNQLKAEASVLAINTGNKLLPAFRSLVKTGMNVVGFFSDLPVGVQATTLKVLAFGAVLGPVVRIAGAFATAIGGIMKARAALAGVNLVGDIGAALSLARGGEMGGFSMLGKGLATKLVSGLKVGLPVAIAGAGIANIMSSVLDGDMKQAGVKAGGALVGGIAGFLVGGPLGAAIGAGAGSFLGPMVGDLLDFGNGLKPLEALQLRVAESSVRMRDAFKSEHQAVQALMQGNGRLEHARHRQNRTSKDVKQAEQSLAQVRKQHGPNTLPAIRAEVRLAEAKDKDVRATKQLRNAERLHGLELRATKDVMRATVLEGRHRQTVLKDERKELHAHLKAAERNNAGWKVERNLLRQLSTNRQESAKTNKRLNETYLEASRVAGPKFAKFLQNAGRGALDMSRNFKVSLAGIRDPLRGSIFQVRDFGDATTKNVTRAQSSYEHMKGVLGPFRSEVQAQMGKAKGDVQSFAQGTTTALRNVESSTNTSLSALGVKEVFFGVEGGGERKRKAQGGLTRLRGAGLQDTIPLNVGGEKVMAAPGEDVAFITRHQRPELDYAVWNTYGDKGLSGFYKRNNRPHYMARGGIAEPRLTGPDPLQDAGQAAIHRVTEAARSYIRKIGGDKTFTAVRKEADRMDRLSQPYLWGGGHGASASRNGPWDCSGAVSQLFYGAGWKDLSPMVSSGFESFGAAGKGQVSVLANPEHVYSVIGDRAWGTSGENPGGGAGWINGYTYRSGFTTRHAELLGEGVPLSKRQGRGQSLKKGFAEGGFLSTAYGPPWGGIQGTGTTATGIDLTSSPHKYIVAVDPNVIPLHTQMEIHPNPFQTTEPFAAEDTGGAIDGKRIDFYDWRGRSAQEGWGRRTVSIERLGSGGVAKEEDVPAMFGGVRTKALDFPPMPKTLAKINSEIAKRENEMRRYRRALRSAEGKPKIAQALQKNIAALEGWLKQLRRERALLRRKAAEKKVTRKLRRKLGKITGLERRIEEAERVFTMADQTASQLVSLEPQQPQESGEAGEQRYIKELTAYVANQERPAYSNVLESLAGWRDVTLLGESQATNLQGGWEKEARQIGGEMQGINAMSKRVSEDVAAFKRANPGKALPAGLQKRLKEQHEARARLPMLRFRDQEVRKVLGEAREAFYGGRKNPLEPPVVPMAGTGSMEETLVGIQGTHWPDQHSPQRPLPGKRRPGWFGGSIWDAQTAIEELDLKVNQAVNAGGGGAADSEDDSDRLALLEEQNRLLLREKAIREAQAPVLANYLGKFGKGGTLPSDGYYYGHAGERLTPRDQDGQDGEAVVLEPHIHVSDELAPYISATVEERFRKGGRQVGQGMSTSTAAGKRARFTQRGRGGQ